MEEIIMQKNIFKAICVFTLVFFVMSMTGAAATCSGGACKVSKVDAKNDQFSLSSSKNTGNVLKNDKGTGLKVVTTGTIKTAKGAKVTMKANGSFSYKKSSCSKTGTITDSFTYKVVDKYGKYDTAKVSITYKCK